MSRKYFARHIQLEFIEQYATSFANRFSLINQLCDGSQDHRRGVWKEMNQAWKTDGINKMTEISLVNLEKTKDTVIGSWNGQAEQF